MQSLMASSILDNWKQLLFFTGLFQNMKVFLLKEKLYVKGSQLTYHFYTISNLKLIDLMSVKTGLYFYLLLLQEYDFHILRCLTGINPKNYLI